MSKLSKMISTDKKMKKNVKVFESIYYVFPEHLLRKFSELYGSGLGR